MELIWKDITEEVPEEEGMYLCQFQDGAIETYPIDEDEVIWFEHMRGTPPVRALGEITHWIAITDLPPAPRKSRAATSRIQ